MEGQDAHEEAGAIAQGAGDGKALGKGPVGGWQTDPLKLMCSDFLGLLPSSEEQPLNKNHFCLILPETDKSAN